MTRIRNDDQTYHDSHCSVFTPGSFELLIRDAAYLGLAPFEVLEVFDSGCEFHAHLRKTESTETLCPITYKETRNALLRKILDEAAKTSDQFQTLRAERDSLSKERQSLVARLDAMRDTEEARDAHLAALAEANGRIQASARIAQLEGAIHGLRTSISWRATEPMQRCASC